MCLRRSQVKSCSKTKTKVNLKQSEFEMLESDLWTAAHSWLVFALAWDVLSILTEEATPGSSRTPPIEKKITPAIRWPHHSNIKAHGTWMELLVTLLSLFFFFSLAPPYLFSISTFSTNELSVRGKDLFFFVHWEREKSNKLKEVRVFRAEAWSLFPTDSPTQAKAPRL